MVSNGFWHIVSIVKELRPPCPAEWHPNNFARIDVAARNVNTQKQKFWFFHKYPGHACKQLKARGLPTRFTGRPTAVERAIGALCGFCLQSNEQNHDRAVRRFVFEPSANSCSRGLPLARGSAKKPPPARGAADITILRSNSSSALQKIRETKFTKTASHNLPQGSARFHVHVESPSISLHF